MGNDIPFGCLMAIVLYGVYRYAVTPEKIKSEFVSVRWIHAAPLWCLRLVGAGLFCFAFVVTWLYVSVRHR